MKNASYKVNITQADISVENLEMWVKSFVGEQWFFCWIEKADNGDEIAVFNPKF